VYAQSLDFDYLNYDDPFHVQHKEIADGFQISDLTWSLSETGTNLWHPLTWLSFFMDKASPGRSHTINLGIHILGCLALFLTVLNIKRYAFLALPIALIHAVHPLHVESVAWISSRKDLLSFLFLSLAVLSYLRHLAPEERQHHYWISIFMGALALLSKPSAIVIAPIILALECALGTHRPWKIRILNFLGFTLLTGATVITSLVIHQNSDNAELNVDFNLLERVGIVCLNYTNNVVQFFVPHDLSFFYRYPNHLPYTWMALSAVAIAIPTAFTGRALLKRQIKVWHLIFLLYLATYLPMSGVIIAGDAIRADRYTFIPLIFIALLVYEISAPIFRRFGYSALNKIITGIFFVWLGLIIVTANKYTAVWKDNSSLFNHAIALDPTNYLAWHNLGSHELDQRSFSSARERFQTVLQLKPNHKKAHLGIAKTYLAQQQPQLAERHFKLEIQINDSVGATLEYAYFLFDQSRLDDCIVLLKQAPHPAKNFHSLLATCYLKSDQFENAVIEFKRAISSGERHDSIFINLALAHLKQNHHNKALEALSQVKNQLNPNYLQIHQALLNSK